MKKPGVYRSGYGPGTVYSSPDPLPSSALAHNASLLRRQANRVTRLVKALMQKGAGPTFHKKMRRYEKRLKEIATQMSEARDG